MQTRCAWVDVTKTHYVEYHDNEWGIPVHCDQKLFEMLILEGAQAGLNWETILRKRSGYQKAFKNFDVKKVSTLTNNYLEKLLQNPAIVRNRLKVFSARKNAIVFLSIQKQYGSFNNYLWDFVDGAPIINHWKSIKQIPTTTKISDVLAKDLKKRGMSFVGSTIIYAYMQAVGMVNDHTTDCFLYSGKKC